ncbi:MAG TPA: hypothetical protein VGK71_05070 [Nitrospirota bacterium]|jgi:hypothetical protein
MKKTLVFICLVFSLAAFSVPCLAADEGAGIASCPYCGAQVSIGRRDTPSMGLVTCPKCGKEFNPEEKAEACKDFSMGADAGFFSKYVSRGFVFNDRPVFQPDVWAAYKWFTVSVWGSMDLTNRQGDNGEFKEFDYTLDYTNKYKDLTYSAGLIFYEFPNTASKATREVYVGAAYDTLLSPKVKLYYDYGQFHGFYSTMGIGHSFDLPEFSKSASACLQLGATVGFASANYNKGNFVNETTGVGADHNAFTDAVATVSLPVTILDNFSFTPSVSYSTVLDRTLRTKIDQKDDNFIFGATLSAKY